MKLLNCQGLLYGVEGHEELVECTCRMVLFYDCDLWRLVVDLVHVGRKGWELISLLGGCGERV